MAGRNAMPSSNFQTGAIIDSEWASLKSRLHPIKEKLKELAQLIREYLKKAKENNFE